ncbi:MAG: hypothetical protein QOJ46_1512 [bacterium]|jgi:hypothetical protein
MLAPHKTIAAAAAIAAIAAGGVSIAADTATQITVEPVASLSAGDTSPFDAAGVKRIRRGKAIPSGYVLVGQKVTNTRGQAGAGAALYFRCPGDKRLKTFGTVGRGGLAAADRPYVDHHSTWVRSAPGKKGESMTGTVYAVCR